MRKLLDAELDSHLEYSKYEHTKNEKRISEMVIVRRKK